MCRKAAAAGRPGLGKLRAELSGESAELGQAPRASVTLGQRAWVIEPVTQGHSGLEKAAWGKVWTWDRPAAL